jgi:hypothetical protein
MSVYISNLPLYTGNTYNGYVIWNDSGETTTYKTLYQPPFKRDGTNNTNNIYDTTAMGGTFSAIIGGQSNTITIATSNNTILGGSDNYMSAGGNFGFKSIVGGYNNRIVGANGYNGIFSGRDNEINGGDYSTTILGGLNNTLIGGTYGSTMVGAFYATMNQVGTSVIAGGAGSTMNSSNDCFMGGGRSNTMNNGYADGGSAIIAGNTNNLTGNLNAIIGGNNNTITGGTNVIMLGTSGRTAYAPYTTYVENLHTYRTPSTQVQPISSGTTFTCDLDLGAKSQFYITGTSTINITNVRDGASFMIKIQTDGNHTMTWSSTGYTFVFTGGLKDPGNNVTDIFVFDVFGSVIYGNRRHNYS